MAWHVINLDALPHSLVYIREILMDKYLICQEEMLVQIELAISIEDISLISLDLLFIVWFLWTSLLFSILFVSFLYQIHA